jgi:hypothetical protein
MSAVTDPAEDDAKTGDRQTVRQEFVRSYPNRSQVNHLAPSALAAAALKAQHAIAEHRPVTPTSVSPTPDSDRSHGPLNNLSNLVAPLNDINRRTPDSVSVAPQVGSVGTPELGHEPAFPMATCECDRFQVPSADMQSALCPTAQHLRGSLSTFLLRRRPQCRETSPRTVSSLRALLPPLCPQPHLFRLASTKPELVPTALSRLVAKLARRRASSQRCSTTNPSLTVSRRPSVPTETLRPLLLPRTLTPLVLRPALLA